MNFSLCARTMASAPASEPGGFHGRIVKSAAAHHFRARYVENGQQALPGGPIDVDETLLDD